MNVGEKTRELKEEPERDRKSLGVVVKIREFVEMADGTRGSKENLAVIRALWEYLGDSREI